MKKIIVAVLLLLSIANAEVLPKDKKEHMIAGIVIYATCYIITEEADWCLIPVVVAGVGKEIYDAQGNGNPEVMDAIATISVPLAISYTIKF